METREKNGNHLWRLFYRLAVLALLLTIVGGLVFEGWWFNRKANLSLSYSHELQAGIEALPSRIGTGEATPAPGEKRVAYVFPGRAQDVDIPYSPTGTYMDLGLAKYQDAKTDEDGVLLIYRGETGGQVYHPVAIAQYGLSLYNAYLAEGKASDLAAARVQADFLAAGMDPVTGIAPYPFDFPVGATSETLKAPWGSAMAQGQLCSLFARLYDATGDEAYREAALLAMRPLSVDVQDGGLQRAFLNGLPFYEEYPTQGPNYTLNGFLFTLIGLYDAWQVMGEEEAGRLYRAGMETLETALPFYQGVGISYYHLAHLYEKRAPHYLESYHLIHVEQLRILNQEAHSELIQYYIDAWTTLANGA